MTKKSLGRGLNALLSRNLRVVNDEKGNKKAVVELSLSSIYTNPDQPRSNFDENAIKQLAASIESNGLIQPIIVKDNNNGKYIIVVGERRYRAFKLLMRKTIPVIFSNIPDSELLEYALIENIQRKDLNPIEEAKTYLSLMSNLKITQDILSKRVGKSRAYIANSVRLLDLDYNIHKHLINGNITAAHGRTILALVDIKMRNILLEYIIKEGLSVRHTDLLVKYINSEGINGVSSLNIDELIKNKLKVYKSKSLVSNKIKQLSKNKNIDYIESKLITETKLKFKFKSSSNYNNGKIEIKYSTKDEFISLLKHFGVEVSLNN